MTKLDSLVEHRRIFNLKHCELNIFETFHQCSGVVLSYDGLVISSMMRGRKIMSLNGESEFDFLPGESVILPRSAQMKVDFPNAGIHTPVQCATLTLDWDHVDKNIAFLNEYYPPAFHNREWKLEFGRYHFNNNPELASSLNRLIGISMEDSPEKDALSDIALKFLLMRVIQTQNLAISNEKEVIKDRHPLVGAIQLIEEKLTEPIAVDELAKHSGMSRSVFHREFKAYFDVTPVEYIINERITLAKRLMTDRSLNLTEICYRSGFNNMNYFIRQFKKFAGLTPKQFRVQSQA